jgi:predicted RNase H-like HicB family nuclease
LDGEGRADLSFCGADDSQRDTYAEARERVDIVIDTMKAPLVKNDTWYSLKKS